MNLTSSAFESGKVIPEKYTCDGENISPPLTISDIPPGVKSLALIMYDPDVPAEIQQKMGITEWNHWVVFNMSPNNTEILEQGKPGINGHNTSGKPDYEGPCPPDKQHRYFFKLYALDIELDLQEGCNRTDVEIAMKEHIKSECELIGVYNRPGNKK